MGNNVQHIFTWIQFMIQKHLLSYHFLLHITRNHIHYLAWHTFAHPPRSASCGRDCIFRDSIVMYTNGGESPIHSLTSCPYESYLRSRTKQPSAIIVSFEEILAAKQNTFILIDLHINIKSVSTKRELTRLNSTLLAYNLCIINLLFLFKFNQHLVRVAVLCSCSYKTGRDKRDV